MKYSVIWLPSAEADLATIWTNALDRAAVTRAAMQIDLQLAKNPQDAGESRSENDRIVFEAPLIALVEVLETQRCVNVMHLRHMRSR
jgi:plasmid stabilization system protein ParE